VRINLPNNEESMPEKTFTKKQVLGLFASCTLAGYAEKKLTDQDLIVLEVFLSVFEKVLDLSQSSEDLSKN
jgi:hypothetical protein